MKSFKRSLAIMSMVATLTSIAVPVSAQVGAPAPAPGQFGITAMPISAPIEVMPISAPIDAVPIMAPTFEAWADHWAQPDLEKALLLGVGVHSAMFANPDGALPAVGVAEVLRVIAGLEDGEQGALALAQEKGLMTAADFGDAGLTAETPVSREQFAAFTARAMGWQMWSEYLKIFMYADFADADQISGQYNNAVALLQQRGVVHGDGATGFAPTRAVTAAEALRVLSNTHTIQALEGSYTATGERKLSLELQKGNRVRLTDDKGVLQGTWRTERDGRVQVQLTATEEGVSIEAYTIRFAVEGDVLTAVEGVEGLKLQRQ
jgi:hypothetical protein